MSGQIGEIPLEDYLRIVGYKRFGRLKRVGLAVSGLLVCLMCTAAGDYFSPWYGSSRDISLEEAITALKMHPPEKWMADMTMQAAFLHAERVNEQLYRVARESPRDATYASTYLLNLSLQGVRNISRLGADGVLPSLQEKSLDTLREAASR